MVEINDIEELELNLVGVVIVIIGVNFLSIVFQPGDTNLLNYGLGYQLRLQRYRTLSQCVRERRMPAGETRQG